MSCAAQRPTICSQCGEPADKPCVEDDGTACCWSCREYLDALESPEETVGESEPGP